MSLTPSQVSSLRIISFATDQPNYVANNPVTLTATMENSGNTTVDPRITVQIIAPAGHIVALLDSQPTLNPLGTGTVNLLWDTERNTPGTYHAIVSLFDPETGFLLAEGNASFNIGETVSITNPVLGVIPPFTHVGAAEAVTVALSLENRSNFAARLTIEHELRSPSGVVLSSGPASLLLSPEQGTASATLATFSHTFTESGDYPVQAKVFHGTELLATVSSAISVAPNIRIEPTKTQTPDTVAPDGDKRIRIDIRLEGVEEKP
jgi:hypothetical protein